MCPICRASCIIPEPITTCDEAGDAAAPVLLITGGTGFVGRHLMARALRDGGWRVRAAVRRAGADLPAGVDVAVVGDLGSDTQWKDAVQGAATVVHAAARVHTMHDSATNRLAEFRTANVEGTLSLATRAADAGVKRFVFISSIKVNGEETFPGCPFTPADPPAPTDPYGISKLEAEQRLREVADATRMELVIIRPVLVYGPGVPGNFRALMRLIKSGIPLPLGAIDNRRSFLSVDNLVDLIVVSARHPGAPGNTFLASDGRDLSTTDLIRMIASAMARPARLVPVPTPILWTLARVTGKTAAARRVLGYLQVDIARARDYLHWAPPHRVESSILRTVQHFLAGQ